MNWSELFWVQPSKIFIINPDCFQLCRRVSSHSMNFVSCLVNVSSISVKLHNISKKPLIYKVKSSLQLWNIKIHHGCSLANQQQRIIFATCSTLKLKCCNSCPLLAWLSETFFIKACKTFLNGSYLLDLM